MSGFRANRSVIAVFVAKAVRTFCYGYLGILLPLYLADLGLSARGIGVFVTATLAGSAALTWAIRAPSERFGARAALLMLCALSTISAVLLMITRAPWLVVVAAMLGNVAVGAGETGPFLAIEQVVLARAVEADRRTAVLSVYNLLGYGAAAAGAAAVTLGAPTALFAGFLVGALVQIGVYGALEPTAIATRLARGATAPASPIIRRIAAIFALDSFAGGFVLQSLIAYFLHVRYDMGLAELGRVFFIAQIMSATSLLLAPRLARAFGLLPTMVVTHLASNVFLIAIALAPTATVAVMLLYARQLLSQIDLPTRQAWVMLVVPDHEREAAATTTTLWRTSAQAVTPLITGWVMQALTPAMPFVLGGALKIVYDLLLWGAFRDLKPHDGERPTT